GWAGATQVTYATVERVVIQAANGGDTFRAPAGAPTAVITVNGNGGRDKLIGGNVANTWNLTAVDHGNIRGQVVYNDVQDLLGGTCTDGFVLAGAGVGVSGTLGGGAGTDTLDYAALTARVEVDLSQRLATGVTGGLSAVDASDVTEIVIGGRGPDALVASPY